jgi:hypothetical protein
MTSSEAESESAVGFVSFPGPKPETGTATLQLLDLATLGAVSTHPGQNLRLIAKLSVSDATCYSSPEDSLLPAGSFAGSSWKQDGTWKNNEIYLMSFYVLGEKALYKFDVLVELRPLPTVH